MQKQKHFYSKIAEKTPKANSADQKTAVFYSDIVDVDSVIIALEELHLSNEEIIHLTALWHSSVHTVVLDIVLSEIPKEDKHLFLEHLHENDHQKIWKFLHKRTIAIDHKLKKAVKELAKEFHEDIKEAKK